MWGHFRAGQGEQFTLTRIATVLDQSDIPSLFGQMKRDANEARELGKADTGGLQWEEIFIQENGTGIVTLDESENTLHFRTPEKRAL